VIDGPDGRLIVRRAPTGMLEEGIGITVSFAREYCVLL
jgi:hypothetical protein